MPRDLDELVELTDLPIPIDQINKGTFIKDEDFNNTASEDTIHLSVKHARNLVKEFYELYSNPKATKADFVEVLEKNRNARDKDVADLIDVMTLKEEKFLKVIDKKEKNNKITITFERVSMKEKGKLVKSIANKLIKKLTPEQINIMLQEGVRKLNDIDVLKKVDKELDKKEPEIKGQRGCFRLTVNDEEVFIVS